MAVWSSFALKNIAKQNLAGRVVFLRNAPKIRVWNSIPLRYSHDRTLEIRDSQFMFKKYKDLVVLYAIVGLVPLLGITLYTNIFIGPATLALIPEGYDPKPWEYYRHPITRFLARITPSQQECHERNMHCIFKCDEIRAMAKLKKKIQNLIKNRQDYQSWYFIRPPVKYVRTSSEEVENDVQANATRFGWVK